MKYYFSPLFFPFLPFTPACIPSYFSFPIYYFSPCIYVRPLTICYRVLSWFSFVQPFPPLSFPGSFFHSYLCPTILVHTTPFTAFIILSRPSSASTYYSLFLRTLSFAADFPYFILTAAFPCLRSCSLFPINARNVSNENSSTNGKQLARGKNYQWLYTIGVEISK